MPLQGLGSSLVDFRAFTFDYFIGRKWIQRASITALALYTGGIYGLAKHFAISRQHCSDGAGFLAYSKADYLDKQQDIQLKECKIPHGRGGSRGSRCKGDVSDIRGGFEGREYVR